MSFAPEVTVTRNGLCVKYVIAMVCADEHPDCFEFDWNAEDKKWTAIHSDMNQS